MSRTFVYFLDSFDDIGISFTELAEMFETDTLKPFELVRNIVERELGEIINVKLFASYLDIEKPIAVLEYIVVSKKGHVSVKIIHAASLPIALKEYQSAEECGRIKRYY